jgi:hypothetical protein
MGGDRPYLKVDGARSEVVVSELVRSVGYMRNGWCRSWTCSSRCWLYQPRSTVRNIRLVWMAASV